MLCDLLPDLIGMHCTPMTDDGRAVLIETPFRMADGDALPIYAEIESGMIRFFDASMTVAHLRSRGVTVDDARRMRGVQAALDEHGLSLSDCGEITVLATQNEGPAAFAKMVCGMLAVRSWERDQLDLNEDAEDFVNEVAATIAKIRPTVSIHYDQKFVGIMGTPVSVDLVVDGDLVFVCSPRIQKSAATIRKLIDLNNGAETAPLTKWVVIDDRSDPEGAKRESVVLSAVGNPIAFSTLMPHGLRLRPPGRLQ